MAISLRNKILFGYIILAAVIVSMTVILIHDRSRIMEISAEGAGIRAVRRGINAVHRNITELATLGESVMAWDSTDYNTYRSKRLVTDTLLQELKAISTSFVRPEQIDTLRMLLSDKENHLYRIMEAFRRQDIADSLIAEQLPKVSSQAARTKTVIRRRKGIAGWFGKKDTLTVPVPAAPLQSLNKRLQEMQERRIRELDIYTDSLRIHNRQLNARLNSFITQLDVQAQNAILHREQKMEEAQRHSFSLIAGLVIAAIVLLVISHLIIIRDLRRREQDRRLLEEALERNRDLSDMRKKIILTLSHDIRGPLNAISGSAELAMDLRDRRRRNAYLGSIIESSRHIARLANSLLDLSRLNEAKETLNNVPFHLAPFLDSLAEEYTRTANDKGLLFIKEIKDSTDVTVCGDADRVEQVIGNLLDNAVKFTDAGTVLFSAAYGNGDLSVCVEDTGIGMDEETVSRIFRPFERAAPSVDPEGFGLGLSITKGLVALLGGGISVSSRAGEGSVFKVSFPLPETTEQARQGGCPVSGRLRLPRRVLVVDDSPVQLRITGEMLERSGITCRICVNAKEVVSAMRLERYDLILADIQMRGTSGFDLLRLLRHSNIGDSRTVPIAAMTARSDGDDSRYTEAGFSGCIRKPFSMHELLVFLSSLMENTSCGRESPPNFEALTTDTGDRGWILKAFIDESQKNRTALQEALHDMELDIGRMREALHRMRPVWEQLGIFHELEEYSEALHSAETDDAEIRRYTETVIDRLHGLIAEAERLLGDNINATA